MSGNTNTIQVIVISLIAAVVGAVLLVVSIAKTRKGKKKFIAGIICGGLLAFYGLSYAASGVFSGFITFVVSNEKLFPAEGSKPISGTFIFEGEELKLPVKVSDLTGRGYDTDYEYFDECIFLWRKGNGDRYNSPIFEAYIDRSHGYKSYDKVGFSDNVVAVNLRSDAEFKFEFNEIKYGMSKDDFLNRFGTPAHEINDPVFYDSLYYLGDNGVIYRFNFSSRAKTLFSVMVGTSEFMKWEMKGLYHT